MTRRVVLTGATGFLGSAVIEAFRQNADDVVIGLGSADYDLRSAAAARSLFVDHRPELVVHLAASVGGIGANMERPAELYLHNLLMGTNVIEEARRVDLEKLVVVGTVCSYPKHCPVPFREESLWTGYPEETNAPYGIAKLAHLTHLQANRQQYGQRGIYLMPTNLYGPRDNFDLNSSHVIPALIRKCLSAVAHGDRKVTVWGTGRATREFLYVDDAARAIVAAADGYDSPEPMNVGCGVETSIQEIAELVRELTGFRGDLVWDTTRPDGQPRRGLDVQRLTDSLGFEPLIHLREGVARTIAWYCDTIDYEVPTPTAEENAI
ncbi:MAG: GDP-L-fucose synthase [bacterium]|nr:GDP-L-fucose synthase [bacterium]